MSERPDNREILRSHDELRGALIMAGRHIRKLGFGRKDDPVLRKLREVLPAARETRKHAGPR